MNQIVYIFKSLAILFLIKSVTSTHDVNLNYLTLKTVTSLLNILKKYEGDLEYVIIQPNKWKHKEENRNSNGKMYNSRLYKGITDDLALNKRFQKPGRHIMIKRILPHGLPSSKLEFDNKYKTLYRPLVRVHKRKLLPKIETLLNIDGGADPMDKYGIDMYDYYDNDENVLKFAIKKESDENIKHFKFKQPGEERVDEELLQPFANKFEENFGSSDEVSTQLVLLKEIEKLLKKIRSRSSRSKIYHDITKVLDKITNLRTPLKSLEDNDLTAPGRFMDLEIDEAQEGPPKQKKWMPHYAPWNYWTYKKIIYQDVCPKGQVKIANLCIWLPPH